MDYIREISSPAGMLTACSDGKNIVGLWIEGQKYFASTIEKIKEAKELEVFEQLTCWLNRYFEGGQKEVFPFLAPRGSEFRQMVWKILCEIPYGEVITYGEIAKRIEKITGKKQSAQAVGGAVGHNPISILIPCHRVVGSDGSLTGYAGGIDIKIKLLQIEKVSFDGLYVPKKGTAL